MTANMKLRKAAIVGTTSTLPLCSRPQRAFCIVEARRNREVSYKTSMENKWDYTHYKIEEEVREKGERRNMTLTESMPWTMLTIVSDPLVREKSTGIKYF